MGLGLGSVPGSPMFHYIWFDKRILKLKSKVDEILVQHSASVRAIWKFAFWLTNMTSIQKIFQKFFSHLHGNYKQYNGDKCDPNLEKSVT